MSIRKYKVSDQEEIIAVWLASSVTAHQFISEETWLSYTDDLRNKYLPAAETWVWEEDDKVVGFISLVENLVGALFVLPQWQGKGIGSQLIDFAKSVRGSLTVGVYAKNERAKDFYYKCGFVYESEEVQKETGEIVTNMRLYHSYLV